MCSGAIATRSCFRFRPQPFSGSFYLSSYLSGASWANTADRAGPVRPSRAPVRPLWTLTPRAALLAATLLFTKSHFEEAVAKDAGHSTAKAADKAGNETKKAAKKTGLEVEKGAKEVEKH